MHRMLNNVFMDMSLTEATPGLSLNSVNNAMKVRGEQSKAEPWRRRRNSWRAVPKPLQVMYCVQKC